MRSTLVSQRKVTFQLPEPEVKQPAKRVRSKSAKPMPPNVIDLREVETEEKAVPSTPKKLKSILSKTLQPMSPNTKGVISLLDAAALESPVRPVSADNYTGGVRISVSVVEYPLTLNYNGRRPSLIASIRLTNSLFAASPHQPWNDKHAVAALFGKTVEQLESETPPADPVLDAFRKLKVKF